LVSETQDYLSLERYYGKFSNPEIDNRLRNVVQIPLEKILPLYHEKFYDAKPPVPLMMEVLWTNIFNQIPDEEAFMEAGRKALKIKVNISDMTIKLRDQFSFERIDDRQPEIPKTEWVKEAMESFILIGYAQKCIDSQDSYWVKYTRRKNILEYFAKKLVSSKNKKQKVTDNNQIQLFN